jgi:hypothetical protein
MKPTSSNYAKLQDRPQPGSHSNEPADAAPLLGTWINTNAETIGITKAVVTQLNGELRLRVYGAGEPDPYDWGEVSLKAVFADSIPSGRAISFTAEYDFGFLQTELQTNLSKGLLIITSLNRFKDGSARSDYFSREYYYKHPGTV